MIERPQKPEPFYFEKVYTFNIDSNLYKADCEGYFQIMFDQDSEYVETLGNRTNIRCFPAYNFTKLGDFLTFFRNNDLFMAELVVFEYSIMNFMLLRKVQKTEEMFQSEMKRYSKKRIEYIEALESESLNILKELETILGSELKEKFAKLLKLKEEYYQEIYK